MTAIILPLPPPDNQLHRIARVRGRPRIVRTTAARRWQDAARAQMRKWAAAVGWTIRPRGAPVVLGIIVRWPDRRERDPGNLWKALGDACEGVLVVSDADLWPQIWDVRVDRAAPGLWCWPCPVPAQQQPAHGDPPERSRPCRHLGRLPIGTSR